MRRRTFLASASLLAFHNAGSEAKTNAQATASQAPGISGCSQPVRIEFGSAVTAEALSTNILLRQAILRECSILSFERELKWRLLESRPGQWDYARADIIADFCRNNRMKARGHAPLWHAGLPSWIDGTMRREHLWQKIETYFNNVIDRYGDIIESWDVVNEALEQNGNRPGALREGLLPHILGDDYIASAFILAKRLAPAIPLVYNDFGPEYSFTKTRSIIRLLEKLKLKGVPVAKFGLQAHLSTTMKIDQLSLKTLTRELRAMNIDLLITELDVRNRSGLLDDAVLNKVCADKVRELLEPIFSIEAPRQIVTWGLLDGHSWLTSKAYKTNSFPQRPLPLDESGRRKPMWSVLRQFLCN
ncbi:endo-1,4-beta-xylanase [Cupriavidus oxalaticus]|uniref:endo-1,4-beta-xylanase n=1 Tax=Cupriavidus oxalaticus TaxID=96344 RepID=UPI00316F638D